MSYQYHGSKQWIESQSNTNHLKEVSHIDIRCLNFSTKENITTSIEESTVSFAILLYDIYRNRNIYIRELIVFQKFT